MSEFERTVLAHMELHSQLLEALLQQANHSPLTQIRIQRARENLRNELAQIRKDNS